MKIYLAGPMSGIPQSNFPLFDTVAAVLRGRGWDVISPAELDDPDVRAKVLVDKSTGKTWGEFLARDVKLIADEGVEGIIFLPEWYTSRGARLEAMVGLLQPNFTFFEYYTEDHGVWEVSRGYVSTQLHRQVIREAA